MARVDQAAGEGAYYNDDLRAIQAGAVRDGLLYAGEPQTPGFRAVRQTAGAILLRLVDRDGVEGWGDAIAVQYAGVGGRDGPVDPAALAGAGRAGRRGPARGGRGDVRRGLRRHRGRARSTAGRCTRRSGTGSATRCSPSSPPARAGRCSTCCCR